MRFDTTTGSSASRARSAIVERSTHSEMSTRRWRRFLPDYTPRLFPISLITIRSSVARTAIYILAIRFVGVINTNCLRIRCVYRRVTINVMDFFDCVKVFHLIRLVLAWLTTNQSTVAQFEIFILAIQSVV